MSSNGNRRPPRPRIEIPSSPGPGEATAVVVAIEQFLADTAPAPEKTEAINRWQRAALLEGAGAKAIFGPSGPERRDPWL